jgi:hypothetical protein
VNARALRKTLIAYLLLLVPLAWFAAKYDRYAIDGDAVGYMDIADLLHAHQWSAAVNAYWHPLYPAMLWLAQVIFHPTRMNELGAYYAVNFFLFLAQVVAMLLFVRGIARLRERLAPGAEVLLSADALKLLGVSLLVIALQREMTLGKVRTDGLLQALILFSLAMLLETLATETAAGFIFAPLMGLSLGLAYLTKSFAFLLALICITVLVLFGSFVQKRALSKLVLQGSLAFVVFALIAGPYIAALSKQKGRFDFGDSGNLNYVWYVSGTEKMHLEPWMTDKFGSATVHLIHPEKQLLASPGIYSYKEMTHGTYPPWFDATYWNEHITPKFNLKLLAKRDVRNVVLILRYLLNHPEPLLLLAVLLLVGGTLRGPSRYAWPAAGIGLLMWAIYSMVNVEERYVTAAYLAILLPLFAALKVRGVGEVSSQPIRRTATAVLLLFSILVLAEQAREDAQNRRDESVNGLVPAWRNPQIFGAAEGLAKLGVKPGDEIACVGEEACVYDFYWARLAGVRIVTEIFEPTSKHLMDRLDALSNRDEAIDTVRQQGARVLVAAFDPGEVNPSHPAAAGWIRLGETNYYALPLRGK